MGEAVKVIVRCRPLNKRETDMNCKVVLNMDSSIGQCQLFKPSEKEQPAKTFTFDGAYYTDSTTQTIYNDICFPLVEGVCEGYNGTVFAYGQTGCGKSFSMMGITDPPTQRGIIPRAFEHIFETIEVSENTKFLVHASYLEIYNEEIRDLLGKNHKSRLDLKEHPETGVYVKDLTMLPVHNVNDCEKVMSMGNKNRSVGATLMNADSSRSHSIFTIKLEMEDTGSDGKEHIRAGKLNLVDLAGSERQAKTGATGDRLKEATKINLSLSALGNVISALVDGKSKHIPYRDSKLTRMLQDSLGGNTKTLMVACLSPADNNYDETLSTLRYANRAKNIKNKPKINEDPKDALLREYKEEIEKLKQMLMGQAQIPTELQGGVTVENMNSAPGFAAEAQAKVAEESEKIKNEYEEKLAEMKRMYEQEQSSKENLLDEMNRLKTEYDRKLSSVENQYPVHMNVLTGIPSTVVNDESLESGRAPTSSPVQGGSSATANASVLTAERMQQEALVRLQNLQQQIVGGEKKDDNQLKEKHKKRKDHVFSRKEKLVNALKTLDNSDQMVIKVYDSLQDEIKAKNKKMKHLQEELTSAKDEVEDLQVEFEREREDYLETIRKQEMQMKLQKQLLERIQPLLRRDCNYSNLDRVMSDSRWDEDGGRWILPELVVERTTLPAAGGLAPATRKSKSGNSPPNGYYDVDEEDRFLQHLNRTNSNEIAASYFAPKRANRILEKSLLHVESSNSETPRRRSSSPFHEMSSPPESFTSNMRPVRLESLNVSSVAGKKTKKKKRSDPNL